MKKIIAVIMSLMLVLSLGACGTPAADDGAYTVGICQLVQHDALDDATLGFKEALTEKLAADGKTVEFIEQNASGDAATCGTICNQLVAEGVDLMMGNATAALQAAAAASATIPVVGTSIT
ncbi:MAG: ABC transporter substrate-binding protein, partial [Oscillospiraceae bacterium]|nr:ABC transporter substrate-binding protein [Oscillospiraceae bacterium]